MLVALLLGGCAGQKAFREGKELMASGKASEGLIKLEEAARLEPANLEYRMAVTNGRSEVVRRQLQGADLALGQGRLTDAENLFRAVQQVEPQNAMARAGQEAIAMERRHRQLLQAGDEMLKQGKWRELDEVVHTVLAENPNQRDARVLKSRIAEKKAAEKTPTAKLAAAFRKPISLEFRDASLRSVFDMISKVSGINFFFDKDLRADLKANISSKNTAVEDAIRLLLVTNQLEQRILNENSILIYPNTPQKLKDYQPLLVRSFFLANADAKNVANTLKTLLKTKDVVVNEKLNLVIMRDTAEAVRLAEKLVALEDVGEAEVMLEVEVLEIQRSRLSALGVQWPNQMTLSLSGSSSSGTSSATGSTSASTSSSSGMSLYNLLHLNSSAVNTALANMVINAKKQDSDSDILANPRIRVRNKEKAKIMIGDRVPVITTTSTSTGFVSESVSYVDVGLKLEVEPTIFVDEDVAIKLNLEVSSIVKQVTSNTGTISYQIGTRNAATVLKLRDGETQILGGLIQDNDTRSANKVPGLGDFPVLGRLFSSHQNDAQKTEIVLSITPRVLRTVRRPELVAAEFESGTESSLGGALSLGSTTQEDNKADPKGGQPGRPADGNVSQFGAAPGSSDANAQAKNSVPASDTNHQPMASAGRSGATTPQTANALNLSWQGPKSVRVGDQFSVVLRASTNQAISGLPLMIGFDAKELQVVAVNEGDFFKQGGGQTNFTQRVDPLSGQIVVAAVRQGNGVSGVGNVVMVTFKAMKANDKTNIELVSANSEPNVSIGNTPLTHVIAIKN